MSEQVLDTTTTTGVIRGTVEAGRARAGVLLLALSAQFMIAIMLAAAMAPNYNFNTAAISDLGVFPETAWLFNTSLAAVGLLNLVAGYYFYRSHGKRWLLAVFALAGIGAFGAGVFPLDTGDAHSLFALLAFLFFNVQALGSATEFPGLMKALSVVAGLIGIVFVGIMIVGDAGNAAVFGPIGHGGAERMIVYPVMLWMVAAGGYLLGESAPDTATA